MKQLLLFILIFAVAVTAAAQTTGIISYKMDFVSDNPEMAMAIPIVQASAMDFSFMPGKSKIRMIMGSFMEMNTVVNVTAGKGLLLMEVMGNKTATEMKIPDAGKEETKTYIPELEVISETKSIIGFTCTKTISRDSSGNETIMWITTELKAALQGHQQFANSVINGVPLEFSTVNNGMSIHFVAIKFDKNIDENTFSLSIPEGYTIVSEEEIKKMGTITIF